MSAAAAAPRAPSLHSGYLLLQFTPRTGIFRAARRNRARLYFSLDPATSVLSASHTPRAPPLWRLCVSSARLRFFDADARITVLHAGAAPPRAAPAGSPVTPPAPDGFDLALRAESRADYALWAAALRTAGTRGRALDSGGRADVAFRARYAVACPERGGGEAWRGAGGAWRAAGGAGPVVVPCVHKETLRECVAAKVMAEPPERLVAARVRPRAPLVPLLDAFKAGGAAIDVTPRYPLGTLADWLARADFAAFSFNDVSRLVRDAVRALRALHALGVVHRAVTPHALVLVDREAERARVRAARARATSIATNAAAATYAGGGEVPRRGGFGDVGAVAACVASLAAAEEAVEAVAGEGPAPRLDASPVGSAGTSPAGSPEPPASLNLLLDRFDYAVDVKGIVPESAGPWRTLPLSAACAPEVVLAEPYGPAADMWAVGVLLFQMLTREEPFRAGNELELIRAIETVDYKFGRAQRRALPKPAVDLVRKLLLREPADRLSAEDALRHPFLLPSAVHPERPRVASLPWPVPPAEPERAKVWDDADEAALEDTMYERVSLLRPKPTGFRRADGGSLGTLQERRRSSQRAKSALSPASLPAAYVDRGSHAHARDALGGASSRNVHLRSDVSIAPEAPQRGPGGAKDVPPVGGASIRPERPTLALPPGAIASFARPPKLPSVVPRPRRAVPPGGPGAGAQEGGRGAKEAERFGGVHGVVPQAEAAPGHGHGTEGEVVVPVRSKFQPFPAAGAAFAGVLGGEGGGEARVDPNLNFGDDFGVEHVEENDVEQPTLSLDFTEGEIGAALLASLDEGDDFPDSSSGEHGGYGSFSDLSWSFGTSLGGFDSAVFDKSAAANVSPFDVDRDCTTRTHSRPSRSTSFTSHNLRSLSSQSISASLSSSRPTQVGTEGSADALPPFRENKS